MNPKDLYPDPVERSKKMFEEQKKAHASASLKNAIFLIIALTIVGVGGYYFYTSGILGFGKDTINKQISDETVKTSLARAKTNANYYYRSYKTYVGMESDSDIIKSSSDVESAGATLKIQGLSDNSYVLYVILPNSKEYYCADGKGFLGKVEKVDSSQTTCQNN
ncbi:MAG: hypothetical protein Q7K11_01020 [Candidatus Berkelbacteria bacterium]|nr:hypothetical protein [Candidatus Berkelbacteria bacterium]